MIKQLGFTDYAHFLLIAHGVIKVLVILLVAFILLKLTGNLIKNVRVHLNYRAGDNLEESKRVDTMCRVMRYVLTVIIYAVTVIEILNEIGISIAPILGAAGVVGLAVGFGAQSLIKDYFNGFFILLENQIRQGDVVVAGDKAGFVEEVTLRHIRMRDYDGDVHYVPNGIITTVTNKSRDYAQSVIDIGVAYREDINTVIEVMQQVGDELYRDEIYSAKILTPLEMAGVDRFDDSAVIVRCRFKVLPLEQWTVRREYFRRIKYAFEKHNIEIPYPHLTLYPGESRDGTAPALRIARG
ncbi:MAG: mechanosensitive ion channel family protein [Methylophilus sp.]|nr:mechanosensitive ion channel family protein [Methylophilus sp.]